MCSLKKYHIVLNCASPPTSFKATTNIELTIHTTNMIFPILFKKSRKALMSLPNLLMQTAS